MTKLMKSSKPHVTKLCLDNWQRVSSGLTVKRHANCKNADMRTEPRKEKITDRVKARLYNTIHMQAKRGQSIPEAQKWRDLERLTFAKEREPGKISL